MPPKDSIRSFTSQYVVFIVTILLTIFSTQLVIQNDLGQQNEDARLINLAGRQRMLSQRISKRALYTQNDLDRGKPVNQSGLDTLSDLIAEWKDAHTKLISDTSHRKNSPIIKSLLTQITVPLDSIVFAANAMVQHPEKQVINNSIAIISRHELSFLWQMEKIVATYQMEAEEKLRNLKRIEWALAGISAIVLVLEFFFIFRPVLKNLTQVNKDVADKNHELVATNEELTATEEELRSNLDFVSALKEEMSFREKQYREVIENATDLIYELSSEGKFSYVNPTVLKVTEFSAEELSEKFYWQLVDEDFQDKVRNFYRQQMASAQESSYFELPIITRSGKKLWVGQNARMYFKNDWVEKVTVVARDITKLKEVQEELERSEFQYRSISEQTSDLIALFDVNNRFTYVSASSKKLLGYQPEELIGTRGIDLLHPDDVSGLQAPSEIRDSKGKHLIQQFRLRKKDGAYVWMEAVSNIIEDSLGNVTGIQSINRDITERRETEEALRESEQRFKLLAEHAPIGIFLTDSEGACVYVNRVWLEVAGIKKDDALGAGWANAIHPDDGPVVVERWNHSRQHNAEFDLEFRFQNPNSGTRLVKSNAVPLIKNGKPLGYIGTMTDVTELRDAQLKLAESEKLHRELLENAQDMTALLDVDFRYIYLSPSAQFLYGYALTEIIGTDPRRFIHTEDVNAFSNAVNKTKSTLETSHVEHRISHQAGNIIWLDSFIQPLLAQDGNITSFQITSRDITFRKEAEAELRAAKQKAEEATRAKSQFLSMMSHEIRTPMNAIIGLTNLLMTSEPRPDQADRLKLLQYSGENLLTIINDILDFSKIEAGKITLESVSFDLKTALTKTVDLLRRRAEEKNIRLVFEWDAAVPEAVIGDEVRIAQVITNLLSNAIKFTEKGSVTLDVRLLQQEEDEFHIKFGVSDTGIGIHEEQLSRIFESFSQASTDTTRKFGGTGLGLTITKNLLALMGSEIKVSSTPMKGSTFSFELSLKEGRLQEDKSADVTPDTLAIEGAHILLVEDNRVNQIVASNFLKQWRINVDFADDGSEAIGRIKSMDYHLILMDLQMPNMDGYEATQIIRSLDKPYFKLVPIIALTADAMIEIRDQVLGAGMDDFVTKPFNPVELREKITNHIQRFSAFKPVVKAKVQLEDYTMGDPELARQLASLILKNLDELKESLRVSVESGDLETFKKAAHKMATSLSIIDDAEFSAVIKDLKQSIGTATESELTIKIAQFESLEKNIREDLSAHLVVKV